MATSNGSGSRNFCSGETAAEPAVGQITNRPHKSAARLDLFIIFFTALSPDSLHPENAGVSRVEIKKADSF
ncbi:MAG: hypothetical protein ACXVI6_00165, partial [Candidatus Aminicenantales bacterium]